ncbi:hypothetical protein D3C79_845620 [compost metagenome]
MFQVDAFPLDQIAGQPTVHAPQVGQEGDVKQANHPEMRVAQQFPALLFTFRRHRLCIGFGCRTRHVQVAHAKQHQQHDRQRQKRHKEEGGLPIEGI